MKTNPFYQIFILIFSFSSLTVFAQGTNNCFFECQQLYPYQEGLDASNHSTQVNSCVNDCENSFQLQNEQQEQQERLEEQEDQLQQQESKIEEQVDENRALESRIKQLEEAQEDLEFEN